MPPTHWDLSLVGQNLLHDDHVEFGPADAARRARTRRLSPGDLAQLTIHGTAAPSAVRSRHGIAPFAVACACIVAAGWCAGAWPAPPAAEYQVKAAYLFNFGQFVEWPPQAYDSPSAPFVIGVVGEDPFGKTLDEVVAGESLGGHPLVVRRFRQSRGHFGLQHPVHRPQ